MYKQNSHQPLEFLDPSGKLVASLRLFPPASNAASLLRIDDEDARRYGEEPLQIKEGERYEYELEAPEVSKLILVLANDYSNEILFPSRNP